MPISSSSNRSARNLAIGALLLVLTGVAGYFVAVFSLAAWWPDVRNHAIPNWTLVALGIGLSILAVKRAPASWVTRTLLGTNVVLAGLFAAFLYVALVVPAAAGPALGAPAPDFALPDQTGEVVRLSDFRGAPLLLVFYRGHW
jgi:hypothetical protein